MRQVTRVCLSVARADPNIKYTQTVCTVGSFFRQLYHMLGAFPHSAAVMTRAGIFALIYESPLVLLLLLLLLPLLTSSRSPSPPPLPLFPSPPPLSLTQPSTPSASDLTCINQTCAPDGNVHNVGQAACFKEVPSRWRLRELPVPTA